MIFIQTGLVLENFAGNPTKVLLEKIFPKMGRKTLQNWLGGRNRLSRISQQKMGEDLVELTSEEVRDRFLEQLFTHVSDVPEELLSSPWHSALINIERCLLPAGSPGENHDSTVFSRNSFEELQSIEKQVGHLGQLIQSEDLDEALCWLRHEMRDCPLLSKRMLGENWLSEVTSLESLRQCLWSVHYSSFLYLITLIDASLFSEPNDASDKPKLEKYMPRLDNGSWVLPLRIWFEELIHMTACQNVSDLARKLAGQTDWELVRQNIYRWQTGKPFPPWEELLSKLEILEHQGCINEHQCSMLTLAFGLARTLHGLHFYLTDAGFDGEPLDRMYDAYGSFYRHHCALIAK